MLQRERLLCNNFFWWRGQWPSLRGYRPLARRLHRQGNGGLASVPIVLSWWGVILGIIELLVGHHRWLGNLIPARLAISCPITLRGRIEGAT